MKKTMRSNGVRNMSNKYQYRAFGLKIESEFSIVQLPLISFDTLPEVAVVSSDLSGLAIVPEDGFFIRADEIYFAVENLGKFRITNGEKIEVDRYPDGNGDLLSVFLMGSCMGAILHQRDVFLLHGSCVTNGRFAILITGDSGAGKSTLASEFLAHGWKLIADDVTALYDVETLPMVQASYPSQKMWQDSLERYNRKKEDIHSLYFEESREKFGVNVSDCFFDGSCPLKLIIRLIPAKGTCSIRPIEGVARVDQLFRNTYRLFMITEDRRQEHFRRCAALSGKVEMALVLRDTERQCAGELFDRIVNEIGEDGNVGTDCFKA